MRIQELGHVVLKVRDVRRAEPFYGGTLGIPLAGRITDPVPMTCFTLGHHHDFAVIELGQHGPSPDRYTTGLAHVAFNIGNSLDEFDTVKREVEAAGVTILFELTHEISKGMHMQDPDCNEVELYVDIPQHTQHPTLMSLEVSPVAGVHSALLDLSRSERPRTTGRDHPPNAETGAFATALVPRPRLGGRACAGLSNAHEFVERPDTEIAL